MKSILKKLDLKLYELRSSVNDRIETVQATFSNAAKELDEEGLDEMARISLLASNFAEQKGRYSGYSESKAKALKECTEDFVFDEEKFRVMADDQIFTNADNNNYMMGVLTVIKPVVVVLVLRMLIHDIRKIMRIFRK